MRRASLFHYRLPLAESLILRDRPCTEKEGWIIALYEGDQQGWGEISPLPGFSQESGEQAVTQLRVWLHHWLAGALPDMTCSPSVAFGTSMALMELRGALNATSQSMSVPLYHGDMVAFQQTRQAVGNPPIAKLKIARTSPTEEGKMVEQLLTHCPGLRVRLDANRAWSLAQAEQFAAQLSPNSRAQIAFIEEPCHTPELSRQFAVQQQIGIAWDESVREPGFVLSAEPYLRAIVLKPSLMGAVEYSLGLIEQAVQFGLESVISSSLESSLGLSQLARLAQQFTPDIPAGLDTLSLFPCQLFRTHANSTLPLCVAPDGRWLRQVTIE